MVNYQLNYLRIRIGSSTYALCLVSNGNGNPNMGGIPHVQRGGTTYDIYLVETNDPYASPARMRTSGGTKAIRYFTEYLDTSHGDTSHSDATPHTNSAHTDHSNNIPHTDGIYYNDVAHSDFTYSDFSDVPHTDIAHQNAAAHSDVAHNDVSHSDQSNHTNYDDWAYYQDSFGDYPDSQFYSDFDNYSDVTHTDSAHSDLGVGHTDSNSHTNYTDWPYYQDDFGDHSDNVGPYSDFNDHANTAGGHGDSPHYDVAHSNAGTYNDYNDSYFHQDLWGPPHSDIPHSDNPNYYGDGGYTDHEDVHSDFSNHSDIAHANGSHSDHEDVPTF